MRLLPKLQNTVIMPRNKTEIVTLTFDPAKTTPSVMFNEFDLNNLFSSAGIGGAGNVN